MAQDTAPPVDDDFERLLRYLHESRGFDFSGYKRASLMRRVRHRMARIEMDGFDRYLDHLQVHPDEFTTLFNTILINVTAFFRDEEAWRQLREEVVPALLAANPVGEIRVWSAGCATGEEPYGLAIALCEALGDIEFRQRVKVYATDVDDDALVVARAATYDERALGGLPDELRGRYFEPDGDAFVFRKDLRRSVIFGRNDLVQDAPISRIDLLACRNTLMYFTAETQARILARLHFALRPHGYLFLGRAEMLLSHGTLFVPVDPERRFFRRNTAETGPDLRSAETRGGDRRTVPGSLLELSSVALDTAPIAHLIVGADGLLAFASRRAVTALGVRAGDVGRPFHDLEVSYRPVELRSMIQTARVSRRVQRLHEVPGGPGGGGQAYFDVQVIPLVDGGAQIRGFSVVFDDVTQRRSLQEQVQLTQQELELAHGELQSANEELETTNEELQSTNEELETTNEELQSSNEELETMNEELHSMNDELEATNEELRDRTGDITRLNTFLEGVLLAVRSALVVVDEQTQVTMWNTVAEDLWGLRQDEVRGRPLADLDIGLPTAEVLSVAHRVIRDDHGAERFQVTTRTRRGKVVTLAGTASWVHDSAAGTSGVLLLMTEPEPAAEQPAGS